MIPRLDAAPTPTNPATPPARGDGADFERALRDERQPAADAAPGAGAHAVRTEQAAADNAKQDAEETSPADEDHGEAEPVAEASEDESQRGATPEREAGEPAQAGGTTGELRPSAQTHRDTPPTAAERATAEPASSPAGKRPATQQPAKPASDPRADPGEGSRAPAETEAKPAREEPRAPRQEQTAFKLVSEAVPSPSAKPPATPTQSAQPNAPSTAHAPTPDVGAQGVRGLSAVLQQGGGTLVMRLAPATLGALTIELELAGTHVGVRLQASTAQAHELLSQQLAMLKSSLEAKGLTVDRLQVHIAPEAARAEAQQQAPTHDQGRSGRDHQGDPDRHDAADGQSRGRGDGDRRPDARRDSDPDDPETAPAFAQHVRIAVDTQA